MSRPITAFIVEDEMPARNALKSLLEDSPFEVKVVGEAATVASAIEAIKELDPEVLFLDIQLGEEESFGLLEQLNHRDYQIIFVTAYNEHAVQAFQFSACDYILKPINEERLNDAIGRAVEQLKKENTSETLDILISNLSGTGAHRKIVLSTLEMMHVVDTREIIKCQSSQNYTTFYLENGQELIISRTLKEYDEMLSPFGFFRVHKSWLINRQFIKGYDKREGGYVVMSGGDKVPVSDQKREQLLTIIKQLN